MSFLDQTLRTRAFNIYWWFAMSPPSELMKLRPTSPSNLAEDANYDTRHDQTLSHLQAAADQAKTYRNRSVHVWATCLAWIVPRYGVSRPRTSRSLTPSGCIRVAAHGGTPVVEGGIVASQASEQMMLLLQELAALKELDQTQTSAPDRQERQRRRHEIHNQMQDLAAVKKAG